MIKRFVARLHERLRLLVCQIRTLVRGCLGKKRNKVKLFRSVIADVVIVSLLGALTYFSFFYKTGEVETSANVYYKSDTQTKVVSLMFNVYENAGIVEKVLDVLSKNGVYATFFFGGIFVERNPNTVKRASDLGMEIGSHGYLHKNHAELGYEGNKEEILLSKKLIEELTGKTLRLFAPPSGAYSKSTLKVCEELGLSLIMWSKDTVDWRDHDEELIIRRATKELANGDFVLMHPTEATLASLQRVLDYYRENGFLEVTVSRSILG